MRETRTAQMSIFQSGVAHQIAAELRGMSDWLDEHIGLLDLVRQDVSKVSKPGRGRPGLTAESILRCAILKQYRQVDYRTLAFYLQDSVSFMEFVRIDGARAPSKSTLQSVIGAISEQTWTELNRHLLSSAHEQGIEDGTTVRIDSTTTQSNILAPTDSGLLRDSVRVITRLLKQARHTFGIDRFPNHNRLARRRALAILNAGNNTKRRPLYEDLLRVTGQSVHYLEQAYKTLVNRGDAQHWREQVEHYLALIARVIDQTHRRVIQGDSVPAGEKVVSLFEPHTDIIVKGRREVQYGHKITLSTGASALVLDVVVEPGNRADSQCLMPILRRHVEHYGQAPENLAADGAYASQSNLEQSNAIGVTNAAFHKKAALTVDQMTGGDQWLYAKLRRFRAGIEAGISYLKRCFGLRRCNWKGLAHFKAYVHSAVFTHNLVRMAQLSPT